MWRPLKVRNKSECGGLMTREAARPHSRRSVKCCVTHIPKVIAPVMPHRRNQIMRRVMRKT